MPGRLRSLVLTGFKSYREQRLEMQPVTLLVGRNGSGKSNALDALTLLSLLAEGRELRDLDRPDLEISGLRGGLLRAAPFDADVAEVACKVELEDGSLVVLFVAVDVKRAEIVAEALVDEGDRALITAGGVGGSGISTAEVYSGRRPKHYSLLSSRLAVLQVLDRLDADSAARKRVLDVCRQVVDVLRGVVVLDPVPSAMREYVRIGAPLDRRCANLSALVFALRDDPRAWGRLQELVQALVETDVQEITFAEGKLPDDRLVDVLVAMRERAGGRFFTNDARVMSDGTLRYMAIVASLLHLQRSGGGRTLVVEEIENGLFPSQASRVLDLLRAEAT